MSTRSWPASMARSAAANVWTAYGLTIGVVAICVAVRYLLDPWMGDSLPLVTAFAAVAAAVWVGGYRPALVAALLAYAACSYLFIDPRGGVKIADAKTLLGLVAYLTTCALIVVFGEHARRSQKEAHEQREVSRVTLRSIGDAVMTTDVQGLVTYMNAVAESLTGWTDAEARGRPLDSVFRIVNEQSRAPVPSPALRALREGVVVGLANHTVLIRRDGSEIPIDDSAAPIRDEAGRVMGCVLIFRDVSAARRLQRERADQLLTARVLASIVESSDDAIVSKSLEGIIQSWNAGAERLFGYSPAQAIGRHISMLIPPERLAEEDEIISKLKAGQRIEHFETERVASDGRRLRVSLTVSPIKDADNNVVGASKIVRDVTRQRESEERERLLLGEAAAANAKFRAFFEQGALLAGLMDVSGTLLEANRVVSQIAGYAREDLIGKPLWEAPWWPSPRSREEIKDATDAAARGHAFRAETKYVLAGGEERIADIAIQPIRDSGDRVLFLAITAVDITQRKRLEDDLRNLAADLAEEDRRKTEFLATLAHELRNPLAPISNAARALRLGGGADAAFRSASEMLERQVAQMSRLVDDLLDMSRITRGKIDLRREHVELAPIVQQAVEAIRAQYEAMSHELTVSLPPEPVYLDADPARIAQVISNLLSNACKFTDAGGHIELIVDREGERATIRVRDNGIGIAAEHLSRVFEMFAQVDTSLERSRGGLGIGLTLVKTLVEMHGGTVTVRSDGLGRGTEFAVDLPVLSDAPRARPEAADVPVAPVRRRILVVDDSEDAAESIAMLLEFGGHETKQAHDGVEAVAAAERWRPHVVLLDIGLPKMNGYDACRRIRREPWGRQMFIIALTGWGQEEDRQRSDEAGFDAHMVKPPDYDALMTMIALPPQHSGPHEKVG